MKIFFITPLSLCLCSMLMAAPFTEDGVNSISAPPVTQLETPAVVVPLVVASNMPVVKKVLPKPSGRVLLTISGAIRNTNVDGKAMFDRDMLLSFGTHTLRTSTNWTDGVQEFEGVLASDIMDAVGAHGTIITATALNDYVVEIPIADFKKYGVVFALKMNGKTLTRRDKGPIWPVYPRDNFPELRNRAADKKWIYLLYKMEIR